MMSAHQDLVNGQQIILVWLLFILQADLEGNPRKDLWPTPERTSQPPPEELNPLVKLLMDFSSTQESLLEDHFFFYLLSNKFNIHRCSDYCLKNSINNLQSCKMEFLKPERQYPAIVKDKKSSLRL